MVGTTRSRVNFFMNKFKKLGFVEYNGGLKINPSLVTVVVPSVAVRASSRRGGHRSVHQLCCTIPGIP